MSTIDFRHPDYLPEYQRRIELLHSIRKNPGSISALKMHYRASPVDFINDWGMTFDPRLLERGLPAAVPFILMPKQVEWIEWVVKNWHDQKPGVTAKSRDMGISWTATAFACAMCLHYDGMVVGFGSRKQDYVDKVGNPDSLFWKARFFLSHLPEEFRGGWDEAKHAPHMRIAFPKSGSTMIGEAGDNIGRGGRSSIYFVDESAHLERPLLSEASLSQTTNCRQDMSSVNGMDNPFAEKFHGGKIRTFTFHWRDDPRKDQEWYDKQCAELNPIVIAQEIDCNFTASKTGIIVPAVWAQAAIGAAERLGFNNSGAWTGALDIADEGIDLNAFAGRHGVCLEYLDAWSGKGSDIFATVARAFMICDELGEHSFLFDEDGLGAGARGDARVLNQSRKGSEIDVEGWRGSGSVIDPEKMAIAGTDGRKGRTNEDFFGNRKAQGWWSLRTRFQKTFRAVTEGMKYPFDELISIDPKLPNLGKLVTELSQPTYAINGAGKVIVDKAPEGMRSPNYGDACMMCYSPVKRRNSFF